MSLTRLIPKSMQTSRWPRKLQLASHASSQDPLMVSETAQVACDFTTASGSPSPFFQFFVIPLPSSLHPSLLHPSLLFPSSLDPRRWNALLKGTRKRRALMICSGWGLDPVILVVSPLLYLSSSLCSISLGPLGWFGQPCWGWCPVKWVSCLCICITTLKPLPCGHAVHVHLGTSRHRALSDHCSQLTVVGATGSTWCLISRYRVLNVSLTFYVLKWIYSSAVSKIPVFSISVTTFTDPYMSNITAVHIGLDWLCRARKTVGIQYKTIQK